MVRFLVFFNSWPLAAWKSHRSHLIFLPSWTTFLWSLRLPLWAKFIPQESHLYWTPSCLVLMCNLNELCPVELKLQRSQLYLSPSCCTFIWLLRVFWSAVVYDIARTLFICLYAYCLCGFEGNIGYSTYRRIDRNQSELCSCSCSHCRRGHIWILFRRALYTSACLKRSKTFVEAYARCITQKVTKRWLRQTLVVERGIAAKYKYNPLARVIVPKICVPVLSSRAQ